MKKRISSEVMNKRCLQVEELRKSGMSAHVACKQAGIHQSSYYRWSLKRNNGQSSIKKSTKSVLSLRHLSEYETNHWDIAKENARLKELVVNQALEIAQLRKQQA